MTGKTPNPPELLTAAGATVDWDACEREAIHLPGTIQPHGILFAASGSELRLHAVSENAGQHFGIPAEGLLGDTLASVLDPAALAGVATALCDRGGAPTRLASVRLGNAETAWRALIHPTQDGVFVEAELAAPGAAVDVTDLFDRFQAAAGALQAARDPALILQRLAQEVRRLTGHDRVEIYQFDADWSGEVVAEDRNDALPSYLGLHFPASDIPAQARALYARNLERQIPDVGYTPVKLLQGGATPLDLSAIGLRSVSPMHIRYLREMEVDASMSVSILRRGVLWGLVACHHRGVHYVAPELRQASVLLAQHAAWQLGAAEDAASARHLHGVVALEATLRRETAGLADFRALLARHGAALLDLVQASGLALSNAGTLTLLGRTPPEPALRAMLSWLAGREDEALVTDHLASHYQAATELPEAAGLLAQPLGGGAEDFLLCFRPEVIRTVTWSGGPAKPGQAAIGARRSFAAWTEQVRGRSAPWEARAVAAAASVRDMIRDIVAQHALGLERMNAELARSNADLEAFAYVAAHDLKEPLRQIETFGTLLERAVRKVGPPTGNMGRWFEGIRTSSRRLRTLIDDLAEYARLGQHAHPFAAIDLDRLLGLILSDFATHIEETGARIEAEALPVLLCDAMPMRRVFQNLISNALKYCHPDRPPLLRISAAMLPGGHRARPLLELRFADNGIGFEQRHAERIFEPFERLHSRDEYEGSGLGLAICRKVIVRHGGSISADGRPGEGSVFTVLLPAPELERAPEPPSGTPA